MPTLGTQTCEADGGLQACDCSDAGAAAGDGATEAGGSAGGAGRVDACPGESLTFSGSPPTAHAENDLSSIIDVFKGSCTIEQQTAIYRVVAPATRPIMVEVSAGAFVPAFYVRTSCDSQATEQACVQQPPFEFTADQGQEYFVFVTTNFSSLPQPASFTVMLTVVP